VVHDVYFISFFVVHRLVSPFFVPRRCIGLRIHVFFVCKHSNGLMGFYIYMSIHILRFIWCLHVFLADEFDDVYSIYML
jgi:hypothetical protein